MIQLRRIVYLSKKGQEKPLKVEKPVEPEIVVPSHDSLFRDFEKLISGVEDKKNIFYTVGHCLGGEKREWASQDVIGFDIDHITINNGLFSESYFLALEEALGIPSSDFLTISTGRGLQVLVGLSYTVTEREFFKKNRRHYFMILEKIKEAFRKYELEGDPDPAVFAPNWIFRLPGTINAKEGKEERPCVLSRGELKRLDFRLEKASGLPDLKPADALTEKALSLFKIDTETVEKECGFLRYAKENQSYLSEPQWYALLSIVGRLEDGVTKCHEYSKDHPSYSEAETNKKINQALNGSGPRTCANIESMWTGCHQCPHYKKVNSPVSLKSKDFIATADTGFYLMGAKGQLAPQFEDLCRFFEKEHYYKTHAKTGVVYVYGGTSYKEWSPTQLANYAHQKFNPKPKEAYVQEFVSWVKRTNLVTTDFFDQTIKGKLNFSNGILDIKTRSFEDHTPETGFLYTLPFSYTPEAQCPNFKKFMADVTCNNLDLEKLLLEFVGYSICSTDYDFQKALVMTGGGSNGKTKFIEIVQALAGEENVSCLSLGELQIETSRSLLEGKLVNISDELPSYNLKNTELFKKLMGGRMTTRRLYHAPDMLTNRTKFIFAGNKVPGTDDVSDGMFRRLLIAPFDAKFKLGENADLKIVDKILPELPGIFNLVLRGYEELQKRGDFTYAKASSEEHQLYRSSVDRVGSWIKENLYWNGSWGSAVPGLELNAVFEKYVQDCKRGEERPTSRFNFQQHLRQHLDHYKERYVKGSKGKRPYILSGVKFKEESHEAPLM